ncbi:hypothetical protein CC86DRAFT_40646 [Ophiobolus disseminans]|uniref:Zn(2)-C6 fungal-type domain-containing protein n=1 Tax=Ophiobolus disseminans TaxID=1469910 RepID=A0A6A6ZVZ3_9PLEO|nr:hypothetical protein CC86DRAFT_40646 [Ophiobolus disseminans]
MNDHQSPYSHMDDDRSSSPKRKKIRQKYAPKACVSCRRSKLKCTGENPCQRCIDNGKRCFYSEDQTAAEVLQNLSRPTPTSSQPLFSNGNGNGVSRRNTMPRNETIERRESGAGGTGMSMETRMARVEAMMEALMQERGLAFTPSGSIEREDNASDGFRSETAFSMPILDPIHPALQQLGQPSPEHGLASTMPMDPLLGADMMPSVRVGNRNMPFPDPARYQQYVASFFGDVHLRHPCVDEVDFNARVQQLMTNGVAEKTDVHFLALCYLLFACCDVLLEKSTGSDKPPGLDWFLLADSIIDKQALLGGGDWSLVQCLLFQAIYLSYADIPALAYSAIRTACTTLLQQNLHKQTTWQTSDPEQGYWQTCVFWTTYVTDHSISMSCGRPTSMQIKDIDVETPQAHTSRISLPQENTDDVVRRAYSNRYLAYMILAVHLAMGIATECSKTDAHGLPVNIDDTNDSLMKHFIDTELSDLQIPNFPPQDTSNRDLKRLAALRRMLTPLLFGRRIMTSLTFDTSQVEYFERLVVYTMAEIRKIWSSPDSMTTASHRHQITTAIVATLLVAGALMFHIPTVPELHRYHTRYSDYASAFEECAGHLKELAKGLGYAQRVLEECSAFIDVGLAVAQKWRELPQTKARRNGAGAMPDLNSVLGPVRDLNLVEIFPCQALSPPLQSAVASGEGTFGGLRGRGTGVLWMF